MGASALMSALNAIPWDDEENSSSDEEEESRHRRKMGGSVKETKAERPKGKCISQQHDSAKDAVVSRMHSSLHTIRPMKGSAYLESDDLVEVPAFTPKGTPHDSNLHFPFRANAIARKARSPGQSELNYQFAEALRLQQQSGKQQSSSGVVPMPRGFDPEIRRNSDDSDSSLSVGGDARRMMDEQIHREEDIGEEEEEGEIARAAEQDSQGSGIQLAPPIGGDLPDDNNTAAALRESPEDDFIEDRLEGNATERKRVRKEKLSDRLMEVFGLEEREEVLEEMRCWLLRSVSE